MAVYHRHGAFGLINAGLGIRRVDARWSANIWAKTLFDKRYAAAFATASANTPYIAVLGDPQTFGITLTAKPF